LEIRSNFTIGSKWVSIKRGNRNKDKKAYALLSKKNGLIGLAT
jgi:hypothetical protein